MYLITTLSVTQFTATKIIMVQNFDEIADKYDQWYDTLKGRAIFQSELKCLKSLCARCDGQWLEVGVGTGRFASELGITNGIDPSLQMLEKASNRGINVYKGIAESLPFSNRSFDGILMALTLCFVDDAQQALIESNRVLKPDGQLLVGFIPADSPWGQEYSKKAEKGDSIYAHAHFRTVEQTIELAQIAGFTVVDSASTLFWRPDETPPLELRVEKGIIKESGFTGLLFEICDR